MVKYPAFGENSPADYCDIEQAALYCTLLMNMSVQCVLELLKPNPVCSRNRLNTPLKHIRWKYGLSGYQPDACTVHMNIHVPHTIVIIVHMYIEKSSIHNDCMQCIHKDQVCGSG